MSETWQDHRDGGYLVEPILEGLTVPASRRRLWPTNEGLSLTGHCAATAWIHRIHDGPERFTPEGATVPVMRPGELHSRARQRVGGDITLRGAAKALQAAGLIREYRWCTDLPEVITTILAKGPVVMAIPWDDRMHHPDENGFIWPDPDGDRTRSHAVVANGVDMEIGFLRIKNNRGRRWGREGHACIALETVAGLLREGMAQASLPIPHPAREVVRA